MDNFHEEVVAKKTGQAFATIMYYFSWTVAIITAIIAAAQLMGMVSAFSFSIPGVIVLLASAGVAFLFYRNKDNFRTEYEYTFTSGDMDFARVMSNVRRKHMFSINLKNVEAGGRIAGSRYARYHSMKDAKVHDLTLNGDVEQQVFLFLVKDGQKQLIVLEPSPKMMELMRQSNPRAIDFSA